MRAEIRKTSTLQTQIDATRDSSKDVASRTESMLDSAKCGKMNVLMLCIQLNIETQNHLEVVHELAFNKSAEAAHVMKLTGTKYLIYLWACVVKLSRRIICCEIW